MSYRCPNIMRIRKRRAILFACTCFTLWYYRDSFRTKQKNEFTSEEDHSAQKDVIYNLDLEDTIPTPADVHEDTLESFFTVNRLSLAEILSLEQHSISSYLLIVPDHLKNIFYADRKSSLAFCTILKNMSTMMLALFCKREGTMSLEKTPGQLHGPHTYNGCAVNIISENAPTRISANSAEEWGESKWKFWTLVRDPFGRWLSAWTDQCSQSRSPFKCYACKGDVHCFLTRLREVLLSWIHVEPAPYEKSKESGDHFFPQMWSCTLQQHYHQFDKIFSYDRTKEFKFWFRRQFANAGYGPELLERGWGAYGTHKFMDQLSANAARAGSEKNMRKRKMEKEMENNIDLMELYLSIYLVDHVYLRYPVPAWTTELCQKCQEESRPDCSTMLICLVTEDWANDMYLAKNN